jgi:hypothetical protein
MQALFPHSGKLLQLLSPGRIYILVARNAALPASEMRRIYQSVEISETCADCI